MNVTIEQMQIGGEPIEQHRIKIDGHVVAYLYDNADHIPVVGHLPIEWREPLVRKINIIRTDRKRFLSLPLSMEIEEEQGGLDQEEEEDESDEDGITDED